MCSIIYWGLVYSKRCTNTPKSISCHFMRLIPLLAVEAQTLFISAGAIAGLLLCDRQHASYYNACCFIHKCSSPVQYGGAPLHVPSSWQWRVALPTSTPPGRQEYCITEPYVQLWVPDTTALGGAPGSPQEIAVEMVTDWERDTQKVLVCDWVQQQIPHYCIKWSSWVTAGVS